MHALKLNGSEPARFPRTLNLDPIPFSRVGAPAMPSGVPGSGSLAPAASTRHRAEDAFERVQRRMDNLRNALGPGYARTDDGPRAA